MGRDVRGVLLDPPRGERAACSERLDQRSVLLAGVCTRDLFTHTHTQTDCFRDGARRGMRREPIESEGVRVCGMRVGT